MRKEFWQAFLDLLWWLASFVFARPNEIKDHPINWNAITALPPVPPIPAPTATVLSVRPAQARPLLLWDTKENVRHSVRLICDDEGLTVKQKNELCATVQCESGFNTKAVNKNMNDGKVTSVDYGLCQWNNYWHGKEISPTDAMNDPEKAVRLMCKYWKEGQAKQWVCFSKDMYKQYL